MLMTSSGDPTSTPAAAEPPDRGWRSVGLLERDRNPPHEVEALSGTTRRTRNGGVVDHEARAALAQRRPGRCPRLRRRHRCTQPRRQRSIAPRLPRQRGATRRHERGPHSRHRRRLDCHPAKHLQSRRRGGRRGPTEGHRHGCAAPVGAARDVSPCATAPTMASPCPIPGSPDVARRQRPRRPLRR